MVYFRFNNLFRVFSRSCSTSESVMKHGMANKPILYGDDISPPVRFVKMTAAMLNMDVDFHQVELFKAENKSEFYTKINPLEKVPALKVGDEVICDSHAIATYLCETSGNDALYPKDFMTRAKINQILFFNSTTLFPMDSAVFTEYFRTREPVDSSKLAAWYSALDHLEYHLCKTKFLASDKVSLGDLCCGATVSSLLLLVPLLDRHNRITKWIHNLEELPCYEINQRGLEKLRGFVNQFR